MFENEIDHKYHYKSDFHSYNIKRKLVDLPPVSEEHFIDSMKKFKEQKAKENMVKLKENSYCEVCSKSFHSYETLN